MIMERVQAQKRLITRFLDIILIKKSPTIGDSLSRRGWSCGRDQFNTGAGPTADLDSLSN